MAVRPAHYDEICECTDVVMVRSGASAPRLEPGNQAATSWRLTIFWKSSISAKLMFPGV